MGVQISKEAMNNGVEKLEEETRKAAENFTKKAEPFAKKMEHSYQTARREWNQASTQVEEYVRKHPVLTVCAALGAGWVIGRLFAPRSLKVRADD